MTPEERKAIAWQQRGGRGRCVMGRFHTQYPDCCDYHEGFDAALSLLMAFGDSEAPAYVLPFHGMKGQAS